MKMKDMFIGTLRNAPAEATKDLESYKLMLRAGLIRKEASGIFTLLPLGVRAIEEIKNVFRNTLENINSQEYSPSYFLPQEVHGFRVEEKYGKVYSFSEKYISKFISTFSIDLESNKRFSMKFHNFNRGFKEKEKPKQGLLRCKDNIMLELIEVNNDYENIEVNYESLKKQLIEDLRIMGIEAITKKVYENNIVLEEEILVKSNLGDEELLYCNQCGSLEKKQLAKIQHCQCDENLLRERNKIFTPNIKTIEDLVTFLNVGKKNIAKTLIYDIDNEKVAVMVLGNREVSQEKIKEFIKNCRVMKMADEDTVREVTGANVGFAGPVGIKTDKLLVDEEIVKTKNLIVGANETDYHYINVNYNRDFQGIVGDFKTGQNHDICNECENPMEIVHYIKIGQLRIHKKLLVNSREDNNLVLSDIALNLSKILGTIVEINGKEDAICWPISVCPYEVAVIVAVWKNQEQNQWANHIYEEIKKLGVRAILDNREERAGVKFKDADLIGAPIRITVGKYIGEGLVEYKDSALESTELITIEEIMTRIKKLKTN